MNASHPAALSREQLYRDMAPLNLTPLWEVLHALVPQQPAEAPGCREMTDERLGFVLHQDVNRIDLGVDKIAQDEIDDAITPAEGHRWFATLFSQGAEPPPSPTCQNDRQDTGLSHRSPPSPAAPNARPQSPMHIP